MDNRMIDANSASMEFDAATSRVQLTFDSVLMDEHELNSFIQFGEDLGSMKDQSTLTVNLNVADMVKFVIDPDLMSTGKVDESARSNLLNLKAELIKAIEQINNAL